jgi:glutathione synthase/RimK-type ligase-like ATP-grasp enzyme
MSAYTPIEGQTVPCWAEATALAESTLHLFPEIRFAGFDVAVAPYGPVIIELNVSPDLIGAALAGLRVRDVLCP